MQEVFLWHVTDMLTKTQISASASHSQLVLADCCALLLSDDEVILSSLSGCRSFPLWKQKLWHLFAVPLMAKCLTLLRQEQQSRQLTSFPLQHQSLLVEDGSFSHAGIAVLSMVDCLSAQILKSNLEELIEMVVYCLSVTSLATESVEVVREFSGSVCNLLRSRSMRALQVILSIDSAAFTSHLNIIIPVLINVSN